MIIINQQLVDAFTRTKEIEIRVKLLYIHHIRNFILRNKIFFKMIDDQHYKNSAYVNQRIYPRYPEYIFYIILYWLYSFIEIIILKVLVIPLRPSAGRLLDSQEALELYGNWLSCQRRCCKNQLLQSDVQTLMNYSSALLNLIIHDVCVCVILCAQYVFFLLYLLPFPYYFIVLSSSFWTVHFALSLLY